MATTVLPLQTRRAQATIGMAVLLASWAMVFVTLIFAYAVLRSRELVWPPLGAVPLPQGLAWANTAVLVASSVAFHVGWRHLRAGNPGGFARLLGLTLVLGVLFLGLQAFLWFRMHEAGLAISSGVYGSVVYTFTIFHAAHILSALGVLGVLVPKAARHAFGDEDLIRVRFSGLFWHFLDVAWIAIFLAVFII